jgi:hypothetical protein
MKKMAQLLAAYKATNPDTGEIYFVNAQSNLEGYRQDLYERLMLGAGTAKLQGLSDTDVNTEVSTYLLWRSFHG